MKKHFGFRLFVALIVIGVLAVMVTGLYVSGSPERARKQQLDQNRVNELTNIHQAIDNFWQTQKRLPRTLDELHFPASYLSLSDPKTKQLYEYHVIGDAKYQLCATFDEKGLHDLSRPFGEHVAGHQCFDLYVMSSMPQFDLRAIKNN